MTSEEYGQYIDDFELGADVMPGESLTEYIERRRREFDSKADGGSIGIEVLFTEKKPRKKFFMGGPALEGQALHAFKLGLIHPINGKDMIFEAELPLDFQKLLNVLKAK